MLSAENQISEQEMDAVIARSTYQESKEASSSPGSGTIIARLHSVFSRASQEAPPGGPAPCRVAGFFVIIGFARSHCQPDPVLSPSCCFLFLLLLNVLY